MADLKESPSQTAGPYVHIGLATEAAGFTTFPAFGTEIFGPDALGTRIRVEGHVLDGEGAPMTDALLEVWQADAAGEYVADAGFGRVVPNFETGQFAFDTIKPGARDGAPCLHLWLVARGINLGLHSRLYFSDEETANATDPVLSKLDPARRATLIAERDGDTYKLDIRVQGDNEMVFFDV
ncbi:protocatechuate 3,4-dioxygenase subunit alpha [Gymnodinialimonas sp.]